MGKTAQFKKGVAGAKKTGGSAKVGDSKQKCPQADLFVTVVRKGKKGNPNFKNTIMVEPSSGGGNLGGFSNCDVKKAFLNIKPGKYKVSAKPANGKGYSFEKPVTVSIKKGQKKKVKLNLVQLMVVKVTPAKTVKQYVNLPTRNDEPTWGRTYKVTATINKKKKNIPVHFDFEPDAKNRSSLPADLKAKFKTKTSKTNEKGIAENKFTVSRFGGDKFKVLASINPDVKHKSSNAKKSKQIIVWRKIWYQITYDKGMKLPRRKKTLDEYKKLFLKIAEVDNKKLTYKNDITGITYHPIWQFKPGKGTNKIVCVGDHNKSKFYKKYKTPAAKTKPKAHLIMCDVQWDPINGPQTEYAFSSSSGKCYQKNSARNKYLGVFDPPLKGGSLVKSGSWEWDGHTGSLTSKNVKVKKSRKYTSEFEVILPPKCKAGCAKCAGGTIISPTGAKKAKVKLILRCAKGPWAGESGKPGKPQCLIVVDSNTKRFNNTIAHEIGHLFKQVRTSTGWLGVPNHSDQYVKRGGQGSHCKKGASVHATAKDQDGKKIYQNGTCIMFHVAVGNTKFCDQCSLDQKIRDLSDFFK